MTHLHLVFSQHSVSMVKYGEEYIAFEILDLPNFKKVPLSL